MGASKNLFVLSLRAPKGRGNLPQTLDLWRLLRSLRSLAMTRQWVFRGALIILALIFFSATALAKPPKGFHEGPYFQFSGGVFQYTGDDNTRTSTRTANDWEPLIGFNFGWNVTDYFAPELQVKYSTNANSGNREHVMNVNINGVLTFITDYLTQMKNFKVLPYVQAGPMAQFAAIPGDPLASDSSIFLWAPGVSIGGGVRFMVSRYGYFGVMAQSDFVCLPEKSQNVAGTNEVIIGGGWSAQPAFLGLAGVHF